MAEESKLQTKILRDLDSMKSFCESFKIMKANKNGIPDIFFTTAITGAILIEAKRLSGKAAEVQKLRIKRFNEFGTKAFVCNSWDEWIRIKELIGLRRT